MNPLRWDVLGAALLFALPVLLMGAQGSLDVDEVTARLPWCLLAGWVASSLLRAAFSPRPSAARRPAARGRVTADAGHETTDS
ncbi:hypothetical protein [Modestobacter sp. Leaf380]|uniref:hypothetical protein n=1 Tax=Modestobacter sp. Leaf380 TaxID=1736356 RepID=UPI0006F2E4E3|nr:hypothetical protein [Modestobacter sp. Leaf380]KQS68404.1 hypothetical protein ASG41_05275 [Modestobacter sp. Leaf380]